ncbi:unnamed protein product [Orchesella dallaii]|uniref:Uncharacterized protein n=1 Tax=Orchesella dallaii TaxID=48710 RepID=A0ABP1PL67_9HEXA
MYFRNSALACLLVGALGLSSANYFPDSRPGRPARQFPEIPGPSLPPPLGRFREPKIEVDPSPIPLPLTEALHTIEIPANIQSKQAGPGDEPKPEPRFDILQVVPRRKDLNIQSRQSTSCQMNYAFSESGSTAVVQSPNYPNEYPNNVQSNLCFSSPTGTRMSVSCSDFNLEYQSSCAYDFVGIAQNGDPSSVTKYCGRGAPATSSTSNRLAVVFKSDSSNPGASTRTPYKFSCTVTVTGGSTTTTTTTTTVRPPTGGANCTCGQRNNRIVGGTVAQPNSLPWRCYLKTTRYSFFCGCSIISGQWIMTAAHCTRAVMPLPAGDKLYVVVGDHDRSASNTASGRQEIEVTSYTDHPNYNENTMDNDMSLLKLARSLTLSNTVSTVCLPWNYVSDNFSGTNVTASGWGTTTQGGSVSSTLREVDLPVLTTEQCATYMPGQVTQNMICTYQPGKDTCQGDSGGSIDLARGGRYYAIGVVSWGIGCARERYPGVYAKTTKYLDWIQTTTNDNFCKA